MSWEILTPSRNSPTRATSVSIGVRRRSQSCSPRLVISLTSKTAAAIGVRPKSRVVVMLGASSDAGKLAIERAVGGEENTFSVATLHNSVRLVIWIPLWDGCPETHPATVVQHAVEDERRLVLTLPAWACRPQPGRLQARALYEDDPRADRDRIPAGPAWTR